MNRCCWDTVIILINLAQGFDDISMWIELTHIIYETQDWRGNKGNGNFVFGGELMGQVSITFTFFSAGGWPQLLIHPYLDAIRNYLRTPNLLIFLRKCHRT